MPDPTTDSEAPSLDGLLLELRLFMVPIARAASSTDAAIRFEKALGWNFENLPELPLEIIRRAYTDSAKLVATLESIARSGISIESLVNGLSNTSQAIGALRAVGAAHWTPPSGVTSGLLEQLAEDLLQYLATGWLTSSHPRAADILEFLEILVPASVATLEAPILAPGTKAVIRGAGPRSRLDAAATEAWVRDPASTLRHRFDPETGKPLAQRLDALAGVVLPALAAWLTGLGLNAAVGIDPSLIDVPAAAKALGNRLLRISERIDPDPSGYTPESVDLEASEGDSIPISVALVVTGEDLGSIAIALRLDGSFTRSVQLGSWHLSLAASGAAPALVASAKGVQNPDGTIGGDLTASLTVTKVSGSSPSTPLKMPSGVATYLEIGGAALTVTVGVTTKGPSIAVAIDSGPSSFVLSGGDGDGLLSRLLPAQVRVPFRVQISWTHPGGMSVESGLTRGSGRGISTSIPVQVDVTVARITEAWLSVAPTTGGLEVIVAISASFALGPVSLTVTRVGLHAALAVPHDPPSPPNLGILDAGFGFHPPDGLGLSVSAPLVSGGGYLSSDPSAGRYLGAVAVTVGSVSVQGVGVLNTKLPGGGWSLVVLADVTGLCVQLGFGIQLVGVGVLVGVNRTMKVDALQALTRSGRLDDLMFPADLVANAPRVAAELDGAFPPSEGRFVVGPTVRLVWGANSLIQADLAVFIELPAPIRVAVLGVIRMTFPTRQEPVVKIELDVLGIVDLDAKTVSLDMSLSHSSLAGMPLTGQAALRAGWGKNPAFLLAVGGFHPHFSPPASFPSLARVSLLAGKGDFQIRLSAYFAVTSNTLQLGAAVDLRLVAGSVGVTATASFDALIQYRPFQLELDLTIQAALSYHGTPILVMAIDAHLLGPGPWHLTGKASFSVLLFTVSVPISATFGDSSRALAPSQVDVITPLVNEINDARSWNFAPPSGGAVVQLCPGAAGEALHPLGSLRLHQRVVPLELVIDRFGTDVLAKAMSLSITSGKATSADRTVRELFAPAQFVTMRDADRISAPSFESLVSGFTIGSAELVVPVTDGNSATSVDTALVVAVDTTDSFEVTVVDPAPASANGSADPVATTLDNTALPDDVTAPQLAKAAATVQSGLNRGSLRYAGTPSYPAHGDGPDGAEDVGPLTIQRPSFASIRTGVAASIGIYPTHVEAMRAAQSKQVIVRPSELAAWGSPARTYSP